MMKGERQNRQFELKKLLITTGVNSADELLKLLKGVEEMNEAYFREMNEDVDKVDELEKNIAEIEESKNNNHIQFY